MAEMEEKDKDGKEGEENPYLKALTEMRETHVPKEMYDKLVSERQELIDSIKRGSKAPEKKAEPRSVSVLAKELQRENITNLDYAKTALELRERMLADGLESPFLPRGLDKSGNKIEITAEIREKEENLVEALTEAIEAADGSPSRFNAFFSSQINEDTIMRRR